MIFSLPLDDIAFPDPNDAEDDGLLAIGGDLSTPRLLMAYANGIFPWYSDDTPILWYAPPERFVLYPDNIKISKSMKVLLKKETFRYTTNQAFDAVIKHCAHIPRKDQDGTWIVDDMQKAYIALHQQGFANSIEVWQDERLVGGLYGVQVGGIFCGESMFSLVPNASKAALIYLCEYFDISLIDCQLYTSHLESMGAQLIPRNKFLHLLHQQAIKQYGFQELFRHPR